jgi:protein-L-isoaspartate(D-aspartate) O-methyltransferase
MLSQWNLKEYWTPRDLGPDAVYHDVFIAYDEKRGLNNGQPSLSAFVFDKLGVARGERVVHLGCAWAITLRSWQSWSGRSERFQSD